MDTFACAHCGRQFYWQPDNVGRTLRCHVRGRKVAVPPEPSEARVADPAESADEATPDPVSQRPADVAGPEDVRPLASAGETARAFVAAHWGKLLAGLAFAFVLYAGYGRIAPVRRELQDAQAALRRATRVGDLVLHIPFLFWTAPPRVAATGTASVTYGVTGISYLASPPYRVRLTHGFIATPYGASVVFSGRVAGEYDRAARDLTLVGDLTTPNSSSEVHFELTTEK